MPAPAGGPADGSEDIGKSIGATIDVDVAQRTPAGPPLEVAKRNTGRHGRSRKRRPSKQQALAGEQLAQAPEAEVSERARVRAERVQRRRAAEERRGFKDPLSVGERPQAPWHPLPLSELLILVGGIATVVALNAGIESHAATLIAGLAAILIGTLEVTLREHMSGYRSHTVILALLPVVVFHSAVILLLAAFIQVPRWVNVPLLAIDGALFAFLFKVLRLRFLDARRERTFAGRR